MSLAAETRAAVRSRPFLFDALRAGVLNYAAAARLLRDDVDALDGADEDTVTAALRRFREDLSPHDAPRGDARVSMTSGIGPVDLSTGDGDDPLFVVGETAYASGGSETAIVASGDVSPRVLATTLDRLRTAGIDVTAAAVAGDSLVVVVARRDGPNALRVVEDCV